ncbi:MAG: ATP-dependent Clp protease proteolytic subunit [Patescibacteria group bacterium]|jgi:ATP-dependent Clp protease protease subunit
MEKKQKFILPEFSASLNGTLTEKFADELTAKLINLSKDSKNIYLIMNSPGGNWAGAMKIYDTIQILPVETFGVVVGDAFSIISGIILQACHQRLATKNSRIHVHELNNPVTWTLSPSDSDGYLRDSISSELLEIKRKNKIMKDILIKRVLLNINGLEELMKENKILLPIEAKKFGLIDEII